MRDAITELVTSLREEGALVLPSPAPWGDRVSVSAATGVVEVSGRPERKAWPCVMLLGPAVLEERDRRAPYARERISEDRTAATMVVRPWPRSYTLAFEVVAQARAGHTASATSAYWEIVAMMQRFEEWLARTPKLSGSNLFSRAPLARGAARPTPADIHEARGSIILSPVFLYRGAPVTVDTARDIDLRAEPEAPGG